MPWLIAVCLQYVKGDLLEGANAYHCDKCNRKVDTVKRLCIKKLPPVLAIQLKRFDYDWEREVNGAQPTTALLITLNYSITVCN